MGANDNYPMGTWGGDPSAPWNQPVDAEVIDEEEDAATVRDMALMQGLFKVVKGEVATGKRDNLRGRFDALMARRYEQARKLGVAPKSFDVEIDGEKVGTYGITASTAEPEREEVRLDVLDEGAFMAWAGANGFLRTTVDWDAVNAYFAEEGELPDGCEAARVRVPAKPGGKIAKTTLRIDPQKVAYSLGAGLGDAVAYLLEGGE